MAESATAPNQSCHVRSISLPSSSHPLALKVEEELRKLSSSMASSSSSTPKNICSGLRQLGGLYESIKELISLTSSQQSLIHPVQKKWVEGELDASIRLLDFCGAVKNNSIAMKDHIQAIKLVLRRRDDAMIMTKVNDYVRFGRKANKEIKSCFRSFKQMEEIRICDNEMSTTLMEVKMITISFLQLVSSLLSRQTTRPKSSKWSFVSKALSKRKIACEGDEEVGIGVANLDILISSLISAKDVDGERVVKAQSQLQVLEAGVKGLESELECLFKQLIQLRVSLLNMLNP